MLHALPSLTTGRFPIIHHVVDEPALTATCAADFGAGDLDYALPPALIAQQPAKQREAARLLSLDRRTGNIQDSVIERFPELLRAGDLLVLNDTKVLPARFLAQRKTGGIIPGLFVAEEHRGVWRVLLQGSGRLRLGEVLQLIDTSGEIIDMELREHDGAGQWQVHVPAAGAAEEILERIGQTPLPPYIRRRKADKATDDVDRLRYQTVYARNPGAIAAPTAGLHLTQALLDGLQKREVAIAYVTLHVGPGTFQPVTVERLRDHIMHAERFELPQPTAEAVDACQRRGGRVVAVGTTVVRVLEHAASLTDDGNVEPRRGSTDLFIYPPYRFHVVDALLTNFHLPRSTLLALVMAFAGTEFVRKAYEHAIEREYRFYSFGDAMFIA